jgi:hemolysin activation/secretion protein
MSVYFSGRRSEKNIRYSLLSLVCSSVWLQSSYAIAAETTTRINSPQGPPQEPQQALSDLRLRLPTEWSEILQSQVGEGSTPQLSFESTTDTLSLSFSMCPAQTPCWTGSLSTEHLTSEAQSRFEQHLLGAAPITLMPGIQGFVQLSPAGADATPTASIMWEQGDQFFTVQLPEEQRQAALYLAHSMANNTTLTDGPTLQGLVAGGLALWPTQPSQESDQQTAVVVEPPKIGTVEVAPALHLTDEIQAIAAPYIGTPLTEIALAQLAEEISNHYQSQGFLTSGAIVNTARLAAGLVSDHLVIGQDESSTILVREDVVTLNDIAVTDVDNNPLESNASRFIRARLGRALRGDDPIHFDNLEAQLRLLREDPLFENVEASLTTLSTDIEGRPRLNLRATQAEPFAINWRVDNASPISTGGEQATVQMAQHGVLQFGDQLSGSYSRSSTGGLEQYSVGYQVPLNALNGTLSLGIESSESKVTQAPFDRLGVQGDSRQYTVQYRQPLIRTVEEELALSFGFSHTAGQTFLFNDLAQPFGIGPDLNGRSRVSAFTFGQSYLHRDEQGAWLINSEFKLGLNLFDSTRNQGSVPDGQFVSWLGQIQRSQKVGDHHWFVMQGDLQLTPNSLLPSEQFVVGGAGSVRGYRQNLRSSDSGFRVSVEDRITLMRDEAGRPELYLAPFLEAGNVWRSGNNPNLLPERNFLLGTGLGLLWDNAFTLRDLKLRLDYGVPLTDLPDRGNNLQDSAIHFSLGYEL